MMRRQAARELMTATTAALLIAAGPPEEAPRDGVSAAASLAGAPRAMLHRDGLEAEIALPDPAHGFYRGTRFDWAGMIIDVRLGGRRFYGPWFDGIAPNIRDFVDDGRTLIAGPQTAATGPAEEFVGPASDPVPGYNAAPVGGSFLKIGVGRLRKSEAGPYSRFRRYAIVDGGGWTSRRTAHSIAFRQSVAADADGYGYAYEKMIRLLPGGVLEIAHLLRNIGRRTISTQVYNHNFTRFDDSDTSPGTRVRLSRSLPASPSPLVAAEGATLYYLAPLAPGDHVSLALNESLHDPEDGAFTITSPDGLEVQASPDTPVMRATVWSIRRVIAVEPFIPIDLVPGGEKRWTWRYRFSDGSGRCENAMAARPSRPALEPCGSKSG